jgi:hypothetical protein
VQKMVERQDSQFQPSTNFTCTGKVADFLNHKIMVQPLQLPQDYVFIIVTDTGVFHERSTTASISTLSKTTTPDEPSSANPFDRSKFLSPCKPVPKHPCTLTTTSSTKLSACSETSHVELYREISSVPIII